MKPFHLLAASCLLAVATAAHADTIINLNATVNNGTAFGGVTNTLAPTFYQTIQLTAGTYTVTAINGIYNGWNQSAPSTSPTWEERIAIDQGGQTVFSTPGGNNVYATNPGYTDPQAFGGLYGTAALALAAAKPYTLVVANSGPVTFYIPDSSYPSFAGFADNTGGVSINIASTTPEPSGFILLGTGALGLIGAVRRRYNK